MRLREELEDAGFDTRALHGPLLLAEIDRARFPRRHEGRFPSYGAIIVWDRWPEVLSVLDGLGATRVRGGEHAGRTIRRMAGGVQGFALVAPNWVELVMLPNPAAREIELVRLRRALGASTAVVSRSTDGIVRVVEHRQIVTFDGTAWWVKPDANDYAALVSSTTELADPELTEHILDFCVHVAGPGPGGTTLVWCLDDDADALLSRYSAATEAPLPLRIPLGRSASHSSVRHLLTYTDGACRVNSTGEIVDVGLHLRASAEAQANVEIASDRGTRHASAQRCSFDVPTSLVFVISDDGPVTVYRGGRTVASIDLSADPSSATGA